MPRAQAILILVALGVGQAVPPARAQQTELRLLFTGDISLSRQVRAEIDRTGRFPWGPFTVLFHAADFVAGNLEGAVGNPEECLPAPAAAPCFDIPAALVPLLAKAGFRAMGIANNHSGDLGAAGANATAQALREAGIDALSFADSPRFFSLGGHTIAVIALSAVAGRDGTRVEIPSTELRQKLRLARNLSELVVVFIHWGSELLDWPSVEQRRAAEWLVGNGAGLIVGHHPHVVQPAECVGGKPVFFSLGNHLFDQKYPDTKKGWIADCRIRGGVLRCGAILTETPAGSSFPEVGQALSPANLPGLGEMQACAVNLAPVSLRARDAESGYVIQGAGWRSAVLPLVSAEMAKLGGSPDKQMLFALEQHYSPIDGEDGPRPYVYEVRPSGLVARWRGSALAWPLLDAALLPGGDGVLCALHRRDSFIQLEPGAVGVRTAAYRWNGFGFRGVEDAGILARCQALFE
jgi:poly-gamma-glutamate synthesis protein (capsule biosynthesis protein)